MMTKQIQKYITVSMRCVVLFLLLCIMYVLRETAMKKAPGTIYILKWAYNSYSQPFSQMGKGNGLFVNRKCPVKDCYISSNAELLGDVTNFDVIIFDAQRITESGANIPKTRKHNQNYIFASKDSAGLFPVNPATYFGFFNTTWTYKLNSDIFFGSFIIKNRIGEIIGPSADILWLSPKDMLPVKDSVKKKIGDKKIGAAWFTSQYRHDCNKYIEKVDYRKIQSIAKWMTKYGISLDTYGFCGKRCPQNDMNNCLKLLETDYYFYFVFENSFAEDYVTKKLLDALHHYTIPIVFGGADYKRFMPDGAYLDATVLEPEKLVNEMFELMNDPERYSDYFKWHNHYSYYDIMDSPDTDPYCKLCEHVQKVKQDNITSVVYDLEDWWNPHFDQWIKYYNALNLSDWII